MTNKHLVVGQLHAAANAPTNGENGRGHIRGLFESRGIALEFLRFCQYCDRRVIAESCEEMHRFVAEIWTLDAKRVLTPHGITPRLEVSAIHCGNEELLQKVREMTEDFVAYLPNCIMYFGLRKRNDNWIAAKFCDETHDAVVAWTRAPAVECRRKAIAHPLTDLPAVGCSTQWESAVIGRVEHMALSGNTIAVGTQSRHMALLDADSGAISNAALVGTLVEFVEGKRVVGLLETRDGSFLEEYSPNGNGKTADGLRRQLPLEMANMRSVKASANGKRLYVSAWDIAHVAEYSTDTWQTPARVPLSGVPYGKCDIDSNGILAHGIQLKEGSIHSNHIELIECQTRCSTQIIRTMHDGCIDHVSFNPSATRLVSGSRDKTVQLFDAISGELIGDARVGHTQWVSSVCWLSDHWFVTGADDSSLIVWHCDSQEYALRIEDAHDGYVTSVLRISDHSFVSGALDGTVKKWDLTF